MARPGTRLLLGGLVMVGAVAGYGLGEVLGTKPFTGNDGGFNRVEEGWQDLILAAVLLGWVLAIHLVRQWLESRRSGPNPPQPGLGRWRRWGPRIANSLLVLTVSAIALWLGVLSTVKSDSISADIQGHAKAQYQGTASDGTPYTVHTGGAVVRLSMAEEDDASRRVFPSHATALRWAKDHGLPTMPSTPLVLSACRVGDDHLQRALANTLLPVRSALLQRWVDAVAGMIEGRTDAERPAQNRAFAYLGTALTVAGVSPVWPVGVDPPALAPVDPEADPPLGPWAMDPVSTATWHQDRSLARGLDPTNAVDRGALALLVRALAVDPVMAAGLATQAAVARALHGPADASHGVPIESITSIGAVTAPLAAVGWAINASSPEEDLFRQLPGDLQLAFWSDPASILAQAIRRQALDLKPTEDAGFYRCRWWAVETLVVPERAVEHPKRQLTADVERRWQRAFAAAIAEGRSSAVKDLPLMWLGLGMHGPVPVDIAPHFTAEPTPTVYRRMADAYGRLGRDLATALGERWPGLRDQRERLVAEDLGRRERILRGLAQRLDQELGATPPEAEAGLAEVTARLQAEALAWAAAVETDPEVQDDVRVVAPWLTDGAEVRQMGIAGVRLEPVHARWIETPKVSGMVMPTFVATTWWLTAACPVVFSSENALSTAEFRERCDGAASVADLYQRFGLPAPVLVDADHGWIWALVIGTLALVAMLGLARWVRRWSRGQRMVGATGFAVVLLVGVTWAAVWPPTWLIASSLRWVGTLPETPSVIAQMVLSRMWWSPAGPRPFAELIAGADPAAAHRAAYAMNSYLVRYERREHPPLSEDLRIGLWQAVDHPDPLVARHAWSLLAEEGEPTERFLARIGEPIRIDLLGFRLSTILRATKGTGPALAVTLSLADDPRTAVRRQAMKALTASVDPAASARLEQALFDPDAVIRRIAVDHAAYGIVDHDRKPAPAWWLTALRDPDQKVRERAIEVSADWPDQQTPEVQSGLICALDQAPLTFEEQMEVSRYLVSPAERHRWCRTLWAALPTQVPDPDPDSRWDAEEWRNHQSNRRRTLLRRWLRIVSGQPEPLAMSDPVEPDHRNQGLLAVDGIGPDPTRLVPPYDVFTTFREWQQVADAATLRTDPSSDSLQTALARHLETNGDLPALLAIARTVFSDAIANPSQALPRGDPGDGIVPEAVALIRFLGPAAAPLAPELQTLAQGHADPQIRFWGLLALLALGPEHRAFIHNQARALAADPTYRLVAERLSACTAPTGTE